MRLPVIQTWRDFREFLEAKKRKREPLRFVAKPVASARYEPTSDAGFARFRQALRGVADFGRASERLDALEHALRARHGCGLPLPRKVIQNSDRSLTLFWNELMVRCFVDKFFGTIGGSDGVIVTKATNDLLDALAFQARIQRAS
jgi:hypothetical protein